MKGQVRSSAGGVYVLHLDDGREVEAALRGRLQLESRVGDQVVIGDEVTVAPVDEQWVIEAVHPRRTEIVRSRFGGRTVKALVANVDRLLVVVAVQPRPNLETIDRLLAVAENARVEPVLIVNKVDLKRGDTVGSELTAIYGGIGYDVLRVSATVGRGLDTFRERVCDGISALAGPSGVGKSTLVNAIEPTLDLRTGALSRKTARGRHTTVSSRLIPLTCGGLVADTPGFSDVGVWGVPPDEVARCFREFREWLGQCRFRLCTHLHEPDCAVRDAVERGEISEERLASYAKLRAEAEEAEARDVGRG